MQVQLMLPLVLQFHGEVLGCLKPEGRDSHIKSKGCLSYHSGVKNAVLAPHRMFGMSGDRGEKHFKPHPQNMILVLLSGSVHNF